MASDPDNTHVLVVDTFAKLAAVKGTFLVSFCYAINYDIKLIISALKCLINLIYSSDLSPGQIYRPSEVWLDTGVRSVGRNRIQINLNQMDRSALLRNQALLGICCLIIRWL